MQNSVKTPAAVGSEKNNFLFSVGQLLYNLSWIRVLRMRDEPFQKWGFLTNITSGCRTRYTTLNTTLVYSTTPPVSPPFPQSKRTKTSCSCVSLESAPVDLLLLPVFGGSFIHPTTFPFPIISINQPRNVSCFFLHFISYQNVFLI